MAVGIKEHFANDWQKAKKSGGKDYSDQIRQQGASARETAKSAEAARTSQPQKPQGAQTERPDARRPEQPQKPQVQQRAAGEAAEHKKAASKDFIQAREQARGLSELMTKAPAAKKGAETTTTKDPVAQRANAQDVNVPKDAPKQAMVQDGKALQGELVKGKAKSDQPATPKAKTPQKASPKDAAKAKLAEKANQPQDPQQAARQGALPGSEAAVAGQVQIYSDSKVSASDEADDGDDVEEKQEGREASTFAVGNRKGRASRNLGSLLGGQAGQGGDEAEADTKYAIDLTKSVKADPIPDADPNYQVFVAGSDAEVELAQKYRVLASHVIKELSRIQELDSSIGEEIRNVFETTPLSKRIMGDIDIAVGKFTGTVYGEGMISG